MAQRRRGDNEIGLREGMSRLAAFLDQQPPFEHYVFGDRQDALLEHRAHFMRQPIGEFGALVGVGDELDTETNLGEGHGADVETVERMGGDEGEHFRFRPRAAQFGENIRVEQPDPPQIDPAHWHGLAPWFEVDVCAIGRGLHRGDERVTAALALEAAELFGGDDDDLIRPWTVTCCGPSLRTRRTNSLNLALAS